MICLIGFYYNNPSKIIPSYIDYLSVMYYMLEYYYNIFDNQVTNGVYQLEGHSVERIPP